MRFAAVEIVEHPIETKGENLVPATDLFEIIRSTHHGHVRAVVTAMKKLGFESLIASRPSRERDLIVAMVSARILEPDSKLATTRTWHTTTLPETFRVADADEDDLYAALDWLSTRQERIEKKLAVRHLPKGGLVLYDLSSSYFEGKTCPLAALGHNRDGRVVHSFQTLLREMSAIVRNVCRRPGATSDEPTFDVTATPNSAQQRAYDLLDDIGM